MSEFLSMCADDVFAFCCSRGWDSLAWQFWRDYQAATAGPRADALLLSRDAQAAAEGAKHVLSDAVLKNYCNSLEWSKQSLAWFRDKLYRRYD